MKRRVVLGPILGEGGFAVVRRALDVEQQRHFAWKELAEDKRREPYLTALHAEAWIMQQVSHPSVPRVYGYLAERAGYLMDLVPAASLDEMVGVVARAPLEVRLRMAVDLADAIAAMHRRGFLHLDVKLANMLVTPYGNVYLIDFGVAAMHWMRVHLQRPIDVPVTAQYAPPEAFDSGVDPTPAADVYALGVSLYRIFTSRRPYNVPAGVRSFEAQRAILAAHQGRIPHPAQLEESVSGALGDVLLGAMAPDADDRPQNAGELLRLLVRAAGGTTPADQGTVERWAAEELRADLDPKLPEPWKGSAPVGEVVFGPEDEMIAEPEVPALTLGPMIESGKGEAGGSVTIVWQAPANVERFEVRIKTPEGLRERSEVVTESRLTLPLPTPGEYRVRVRALVGDLAGPWAEPLEVRVASGGRWLIAAAVGIMVVALAVGSLLVWDLTGGGSPAQEAGATVPADPKSPDIPGQNPGRQAGSTAQPVPAQQLPPVSSRNPAPELPPPTPAPEWEEEPRRGSSSPVGIADVQPEDPGHAGEAMLQTAARSSEGEMTVVTPVAEPSAPGRTEEGIGFLSSAGLESGADAGSDFEAPASTPEAPAPHPKNIFVPETSTRPEGPVMLWVTPTNRKVSKVNGMPIGTPAFRVNFPAQLLVDGSNTLELASGERVSFSVALSGLRSGQMKRITPGSGPLRQVFIKLLKPEEGN